MVAFLFLSLSLWVSSIGVFLCQSISSRRHGHAWLSGEFALKIRSEVLWIMFVVVVGVVIHRVGHVDGAFLCDRYINW